MRARRRPVAVFCVALVAVAALVPGLCAFEQALLQPCFILLVDESPVAFVPPPARADEQPAPLASSLASRAPPRSARA
jgi:hypothetical protein